MTLHVEIQGSGQPLLLIHGWGMHGGMWGEAAQKLSENFCVHSVDLPGHGYSQEQSLENTEDGLKQLDEWVLQLASQFANPLAVCGWSLGGQIALHWARQYPKQISNLILLATTPCFVQKENWACAMGMDTLQTFSSSLQENYAQTLKRFLALQVRGGEHERELLSKLRLQLMSHGEPNLSALQAGLNILRDVDFRGVLHEIKTPTLLLAGERDTLTPLNAMKYLQEKMPNTQLNIISGASHAPFMSHQEAFVNAVCDFIKQDS